MSSIDNLLVTIAKLRDRDTGCPWDISQTNDSLKRYLVEEVYEVISAIDENSVDNLKEELGDLLFQICLHAQIQNEKGNFSFEDIARDLNEKMIFRHPHVFKQNSRKLEHSEQVVDQWEELKKIEKQNKNNNSSPFTSIPLILPSLLRIFKIFKKADKLGLSVKQKHNNLINIDNIVNEELLIEAFLQLIIKAKDLKIDPEEALRKQSQIIQKDFESQIL